MSRADELAAIESGMLAVRGLNNATITANKVLSEHETGVVLVDASANSVLIVLPAATKPMDVRVQRVDNSGNNLTVRAANGDLIKFHTHLRASGYGHFVLMGAGDYWHLRSDGAGAWIPLDRLDPSAIGRPVFDTSKAVSPGGWGYPNGSFLTRADWPWLWDFAQQSGLLVGEEVRVGMEGAWTNGDGTTTFRVPDLRGEFMRVLDDGRGADTGRVAGSFQYASLVTGEVVDAVSSFRRMTALRPKFYDQSNATEAIAVATTTATMNALTVSANGAYIGASRPRNIAYPARIKLI